MTATSELAALDLTAVKRLVGDAAFGRGVAYAKEQRVSSVAWDASTRELTGRVRGSGPTYDTTAHVGSRPGGRLVIDRSTCSCPVGRRCKHVAALAVAATRNLEQARDGDGDGGPDHAGVSGGEPEPDAVPEWERALRSLAVAPRSAPVVNDIPLSLEFTLRSASRWDEDAMPTVTIRLMRPDAGSDGRLDEALLWGTLEPSVAAPRGVREDHLVVARELYALSKSGSAGASARALQTEQYLTLNTVSSARLWSVLAEARRVGMRLTGAGRGAADLGRLIGGEVVFDATRTRSGGQVTAQLHVRPGTGPEPAVGTPPTSTHLAKELALEPVAFIGMPAHGVVCLQGDPAIRFVDRPMRLVQLATPVPAAAQRLLLSGEGIAIPEADLDRFGEEFWPQLRAVAPVLSSDDSLAPPTISAPMLTLVARYHPEQQTTLSWAWTYAVGRSTRRSPLNAGQAGAAYRDPEAEAAILAQVDLRRSGLRPLGLIDAAGRPIAGATQQLEGAQVMHFTTDLLPALRARGELEVVVDGTEPEYRDVTETLVIGVSTADRGDPDWFDLGITISVDGTELPFDQVFAALAAGQTKLIFEDGSFLSLEAERLHALRALIEEARALTDAPPGELRINRYQSDLWSELVALGVVGEQAAAWKAQVDALAQLSELPDHPLPAGLLAELRPYQHDGFRWLSTLRSLGLGGILADDMGLGKTLQALAMIVEARDEDPDAPPFLVVAPTSVVGNWVTEAQRFAPGLSVLPIIDTLAKAGTTLEDILGGSGRPAIVVTTYTLLRLDAEAYGAQSWSGLILDEAQYVKNPRSKTYRHVRELRAPFTVALTGTPMENNVMELWALLSIAAPGLFPDPGRFGEHFARPIERGHTERRAVLRRRIRPLMLRRTKELVAPDLPAKQEQRLEVTLDPRHRKLYDTYLQRERQKILGLLDDFGRNRVTILQSITLLRQLSLDPGLVDPEHSDIPGAKLDALVEHLEEVVDGGHRALVFSQFTRFLGKVRDRLDADGIAYSYLDGSTRKRPEVIDGFKNGTDPVFLISLKAGGFGLNLTEADYCFLLDPWWNPAAEAQAIDRTHRIGQTRPVMVYRLISEDTIEQKVAALAARKAELFRGVVDDGDLFASSITAEDIRGLLG